MSKPTNKKTEVQRYSDDGYGVAALFDGDLSTICVCEDMYGEDGEELANAKLISEAFNVHHETGLTPRQLLEQRDEAVNALYFYANIENYLYQGQFMQNGPIVKDLGSLARTAIAKIKGAKP